MHFLHRCTLRPSINSFLKDQVGDALSSIRKLKLRNLAKFLRDNVITNNETALSEVNMAWHVCSRPAFASLVNSFVDEFIAHLNVCLFT